MVDGVLHLQYVVSVVLFGSSARGDRDSFSDTDVCVFVDDLEFEDLLRAKGELASCLSLLEGALSLYTRSTAEKMRSHGSLFLWHLRLEGKVLYDKNQFVERLLCELPRFCGYHESLCTYRSVWQGVREAHSTFEGLTEFDCHVLHGLVRDCCILLCYFWGCPSFGRSSAYEQTVSQVGSFPVDSIAFCRLTNWHLNYLRNVGPVLPLPQKAEAESLVRSVGEVIDLCESLLPFSSQQNT